MRAIKRRDLTNTARIEAANTIIKNCVTSHNKYLTCYERYGRFAQQPLA